MRPCLFGRFSAPWGPRRASETCGETLNPHGPERLNTSWWWVFRVSHKGLGTSPQVSSGNAGVTGRFPQNSGERPEHNLDRPPRPHSHPGPRNTRALFMPIPWFRVWLSSVINIVTSKINKISDGASFSAESVKLLRARSRPRETAPQSRRRSQTWTLELRRPCTVRISMMVPLRS